MTEQQIMHSKVVLIRAAVWGQAVGMLLMTLTLAVEDLPEFFKRASFWEFILPIIAIIFIQIKRPSIFLARSLSTGMMVFFVLTISISTTAIALANTLHAFAIPEFLVTPGWQYTRTTSIIVLVVFSLALILNIVLMVRALQGDNKLKTDAQKPVR